MTTTYDRKVYGVAFRDGLPEHTQYTDTGCEVSPSCLRCPLPVCRYDYADAGSALRALNAVRVLKNAQRDDEIRRLRAEGLSLKEIAERFQIGTSSVFRVVREAS